MTVKRTLRYYWLKFRRLQGSPQKLAWGMFLGVFVGMTPTIPLHTILALSLAPLLRISPVTAYMGIWLSNPITIVPIYWIAYEVGRLALFRGEHLKLPETLDLPNLLHFVWRGGLALQVGGIIIALPSAIIAYFLTLWVVQRYRRRRLAHKAASVQRFSQDHPPASRPEA